MRGIKKAVTPIALMGAFALALFTQSSTARADSSAPNSFWNQVVGAEHSSHLVLPATVRAVRTPSKPAPPIRISATGGTLVYLKSHHRDPVIIFEVKLSRAPGKTGVDVAYATMGNNPTANTLFDNVSGEAIFHGTSTKYKVTVPVIAAFGTTPGNYVLLNLTNPIDGMISNGQGAFGLVTKVAKGNKR